MWTPVTPMPITPLPDSLKPAQPQQQSYALGWGVQDYRGHRIIQHSGGVFGSITRVVMIPDRDVGFAIMMNSEDSGRSEEHTSELQSLMRISYAVFCLKKKKTTTQN